MEYFLIHKTNENSLIVTALTYHNLIEFKKDIEIEIKSMNYSGKVWLDMLCCNGNSSNRFLVTVFNDGKLDIKKISIETPPQTIIEQQQKFHESTDTPLSVSC